MSRLPWAVSIGRARSCFSLATSTQPRRLFFFTRRPPWVFHGVSSQVSMKRRGMQHAGDGLFMWLEWWPPRRHPRESAARGARRAAPRAARAVARVHGQGMASARRRPRRRRAARRGAALAAPARPADSAQQRRRHAIPPPPPTRMFPCANARAILNCTWETCLYQYSHGSEHERAPAGHGPQSSSASAAACARASPAARTSPAGARPAAASAAPHRSGAPAQSVITPPAPATIGASAR
jgi:hypothetical protein